MSGFEQIGVNYQHDSNSAEEAIKNFQKSCNCCCHTGRRIDCDRCAIAYAHQHMVAFFADQENIKKGV